MQQTIYSLISKSRVYSNQFLFTLIGLLFVLSTPLAAQGDLLLFPKGVVFEGAKKSDMINLTNSGNDTSKYFISFVQIRMNENGNFENNSVPDSFQFFADSFIRYYPRTVTLAPHE